VSALYLGRIADVCIKFGTCVFTLVSQKLQNGQNPPVVKSKMADSGTLKMRDTKRGGGLFNFAKFDTRYVSAR